MNPQINPYSPPQSGVFTAPEPLEIVPAERWRRLVTYVIDSFAFFFLAAIVGALLALGVGDEAVERLEGVPDFVLTQALVLVYYAALEGATGRTVGKLLMGTRVVNEDGNPPSFRQILGRTLARLIPFEALAIFGEEIRTWHDSLANTYVVKCR